MTQAASSARPIPRAQFLDSTRGTAMFFVLVAHFLWIYFKQHPGHAYVPALVASVQLAAPTFMLISGLLLGYVRATRPGRYPAFRIKLMDRGMFLLTIGHLIIAMAYVNYAGGWAVAWRYGQIIDAIGVALFVGPWLLQRLSRRTRLAFACFLLALSWALILLWHPESPALKFLKDTFVGGGDFWRYNFPVLPWLSLYLVGTALGEVLGDLLSSGRMADGPRLLWQLGAGAMGTAILLKGAQQLAKRLWAPESVPGEAAWYALTHVLQKVPPGPGFFLFYGGMGLLLLSLMLRLELEGRGARYLAFTAVIGQNSLFIFLIQEHLYVQGLWRLNAPYGWWWPVLCFATVALTIAITFWWHRMGFGRYLTVGYGSSWGPRPAPAPAAGIV